MKRYQKVLAMVLAAVLLVAGTFLATVAWMTTNEDAKENVFTVGNLDITLQENTDVQGEGGTVTGNTNGASYTGVMPGDYLIKEVSLTNNGNVPVYAALTVTVDSVDEIRAAIDAYYTANGQADQIESVYDHIFAGWGMNSDDTGKGMAPTITGTDMPDDALQVDAVVNVGGNVSAYTGNWLDTAVYTAGNTTMGIDPLAANELRYTYIVALEPGETFVPFVGLNVPEYFDNAQMEMFNGLTINVDAAAIQADNIGTAKEAIEALYGVTAPAIPRVVVTTLAELQAALDSGEDVSVTLGANIEGDLIIDQPKDKDTNIVIDGNGKTYNGQMKIRGNSSETGNDTLVIKNVNFVTEESDQQFIWSADTKVGSVWRYAHNVTIENCTFTASGDAVHTAVGVKFQQAYNIKLVNCTGNNLHSLLQAESCGSNVSVDGSKVVNGKNGISLNNTMVASVTNTTIESVVDGGYGIRHKGQVDGYSLTVENCNISAFVPVLIRNLTATGYTATFSGTNTLTATNSFGYQVVLSADDWDDDASAPVAPTGSYTLTGADEFTVFAG